MILSIIIPVYHVERTLDRCVEGVLRQDLDDFEVILVDDGGDDNCPRMCDEWSRRDTHVRVVHQSNAGLSAARNAGIELAQGDYLTFVDSDATSTRASMLVCCPSYRRNPTSTCSNTR